MSLLAAFTTLGAALPGYGQSPSSSGDASQPGQVSAPIYFQIGKSTIDPAFMGNREHMDRFAKTLREILSNPDYVVNKVRVVGMASPDGSRERNEELAGARAQSLADFLIRETGISADKIDVVNGGENWDGLFAMIEASKEIPDKAKMLEFRELYGGDRDRLKRNMQYYNGARAWTYMYKHFFPILRTGAGGTDGDQRLSNLSITNWQRIRDVVRDSDLEEVTKRQMLAVISQAEVDNRTDAGSVMTRLRALCPDEAVYARFQHRTVESLLGESNAASTNNWALLRERIAASDIEGKEDIVHIIDSVPASRGREQELRALNGGESYRRIERLYPELLTDVRQGNETGTSLAQDNWHMFRKIVSGSDMPDKDKVLEIIDDEPDPTVREHKLRELNGGQAYRELTGQVLPALLSGSGLSSGQKQANRALLRERIADSDIENKHQALQIVDREIDPSECERQLRALNGGRTYREIVKNVVPELLTTELPGAVVPAASTTVSAENWRMMRGMIEESDIPDKDKVLGVIDNEPDPTVREHKLRELNGGWTYLAITERALPELLSGSGLSSGQKQANRALLRERIADSDIENKQQALQIVDREIDPAECERQLRALNGGSTYREIAESVVLELLTTELPATVVPAASTTVSAENWRMLRGMIEESDMPDKDRVLGIIDNEPEPTVRERKLRELNDGYTDRYIKEVFFPELLYGISPAAKENWALLEKSVVESDLANKDKVLKIMKDTPAGAEREEALRGIDDGKTWETISRQNFTELLQNTEQVESSGTGMSFTFEASPAAKARAEELRRQEEEARLAEQRRLEEERLAEERRREEERRRIEEEKAREAARLAAVEHRKLKASAALKTDFVLWGSLMPGFGMGSFTPNLSAEVYFAKRWSVQLGGAYSNWDALGGDHGLYAVTAVDLEPRWWLKDNGLFRGFYAGVFGTYGDFDIQQKEQPTGYTGTYFMGGITGGWCQVLGRHLYLEAALRLGLRSAKGDNYTLLNGHYYWDSSESLGKFAPQVRLQLVYRFGKPGK